MNTDKSQKKNVSLTHIVSRSIIMALVGVLVLDVICDLLLHYCYERTQITKLLSRDVNMIRQELDDQWDVYVSSFASAFEDLDYSDLEEYPDWLPTVADDNRFLTELSITDENGTIAYSSNPDVIGSSLHSSGHNDGMYYRNAIIPGTNRYVEVGTDDRNLYENASDNMLHTIYGLTISRSGFYAICNEDGQILSCTTGQYDWQYLSQSTFDTIKKTCDTDTVTLTDFLGFSAFIYPVDFDNFYVIGVLPRSEMDMSLIIALGIAAFTIILISIGIFFILTHFIRDHVISRIQSINSSLQRITDGDLDVRVSDYSSQEFTVLSEGINTTVDKLNILIDEASKKYDQELSLARTIQHTSVPNVFPPFPGRNDFAIFASMDTAKMVGGDFYDFFLISDNTLALVIADVSDKGIPAAMFMMRARTAIKSYSESGISVDEVMVKVNEDLTEGNDAMMFVTVWICFLDLETGHLDFVHAGHTDPVVTRMGKTFLIKKERDLFVGAIAGLTYTKQEYELMPGDTLFLYTDGVTEAFNPDSEEYGLERLMDVLSKNACAEGLDDDAFCQMICSAVRKDVEAFAKGTPQSDDITMLFLKYNGQLRG